MIHVKIARPVPSVLTGVREISTIGYYTRYRPRAFDPSYFKAMNAINLNSR